MCDWNHFFSSLFCSAHWMAFAVVKSTGENILRTFLAQKVENVRTAVMTLNVLAMDCNWTQQNKTIVFYIASVFWVKFICGTCFEGNLKRPVAWFPSSFSYSALLLLEKKKYASLEIQNKLIHFIDMGNSLQQYNDR